MKYAVSALVRDVLSTGPIGVVILATPIVTLALAVVGIAARGQVGRVATLGALSSLLLGMVAAWAEVYGARSRFMELTLHPERADVPSKAGWTAVIELGKSIATQGFGSGAAIGLVPLVAVAAGLTWARAENGAMEKARAWTVTMAIALPAIFTAALLWTDANGKVFSNVTYDELMGSYATLNTMVPWIVVAGAAGGVAAVIVVLKAGTTSRVLRVTGVALGVVGIAAFVATRARAADAAAPLPFVQGEPWDGIALPIAPRDCWPVGDAPTLILRSGVMEIDGTVAKDLRDLQRILVMKRALYTARHPVMPIWAGMVYIAASNPHGDDVQAVVDAAAAIDQRAYGLFAPVSVTVETRTLGVVERRPRACAVRLVPTEPVIPVLPPR